MNPKIIISIDGIRRHNIINFKYLLLCFFLLYCSYTSFGQKESPLYLRAPEVLNGTLPEIRQTSFWIDRMERPDEIIMQSSEILKMNEAYYKKIKEIESKGALSENVIRQLQSWPGRIAAIPELSSKTRMELMSIVRDRITSGVKYLRGRSYGNIQGIGYDNKELEEMENEMYLENVNDKFPVYSGITVKDAQLRIIPALRNEFIGLSDIRKTRWDMWNLDIVPIGSLVEVLHISKSGGHLFVLSKRGYGWMRSEDIAFDTKNNILAICQAKDFIVCTGDLVPYYSGEECIFISGWIRMGDRLPYVYGSNNRRIKVPTRKVNGELLVQEAWLAKDADVNIGYVPYTRKNIILLNFKLLDRLYDWTGGWFGRNHITQLRDSFRCFGFEFPAIGELMAIYNENTSAITPDKGKEAQYNAMFSNTPFTTIQISNGHSQLYLGKYNTEPYVFDTHGYGYTNPDGKEYEIRRSCIGNLSQPAYFLKNQIYFITIEVSKK